MKPAPFHYLRARSFGHAVQLLGELGDEARILAGGQSLVPMMNLRLARPTALIDLNGVPDGNHIFVRGEAVEIGALVRHGQVERHPGDLGPFEVLRRAAGFIGHYGIRARGTVGGSIAHADPAAEWCLLAILLDGRVHVLGPEGARVVPAAGFLTGPFSTTLGEGEVVTGVEFRRVASHASLAEFAPRRGDFAVVAAAVALQIDGSLCQDVRIALAGVGPVPVRVQEAERSLLDQEPSPAAFRAAAGVAAETVQAQHAPDEAHHRQLVRSLVTQALEEAVGTVR